MEIATPVLVLSLLVIGMVYFIAKSKKPADIQNATSIPEIPEHSQSSPELKVIRTNSPTQRESRQEDIKTRQKTDFCLYCDKRAIKPIPQLDQIRLIALFDWLYRYLNVVPVHRWQIVEEGTTFDLCEIHQGTARSHLERKVAENQVDYAAFVERQRHEMYEYVQYALDERMLDDVNAIKRGKKQKKTADVTNIQRANLKVANGNNT